MTTPDFPAPVEDPDSAPYWDSLREHALQLPYCTACGRFFFYPRTICPRCHAAGVEWRPASGRGVIYSFTVVRRAPSPAFAADVPYTVALADLDEGCRIVARVVPADAAQVAVGSPVQVDYHDITDALTLPVLRLRTAGSTALPASGRVPQEGFGARLTLLPVPDSCRILVSGRTGSRGAQRPRSGAGGALDAVAREPDHRACGAGSVAGCGIELLGPCLGGPPLGRGRAQRWRPGPGAGSASLTLARGALGGAPAT